MTLPKWTALVSICCVLSDLVSSSNENWTITLTEQKFNVAKSSNITINCTVRYAPPEESKKNIQGFWKAFGKREVETKCVNKRAFIFHPNDSCVLMSFRGRTRLLGNISDGNCSLFISNTQSSDTGDYYFRVETGSNQYSFTEKKVTINIIDETSNNTTNPSTEVTTNATTTACPSTNPISIALPVGLFLLAVLMGIGIVCFFRQRKRKRNLVKQGNNHYENFQMSRGMPPDDGHKWTGADKKEQEPPITPIYANVQALKGGSVVEPTDSDPAESIYCNIAYNIHL